MTGCLRPVPHTGTVGSACPSARDFAPSHKHGTLPTRIKNLLTVTWPKRGFRVSARRVPEAGQRTYGIRLVRADHFRYYCHYYVISYYLFSIRGDNYLVWRSGVRHRIHGNQRAQGYFWVDLDRHNLGRIQPLDRVGD